MASVSDFDYVLQDWGNKVVKKIQDNMERLGINASGKTSESLEAVLTDNGIQILGAPYFAERTEVGRTPTVNPENFDFAAVIAKWITEKGIESRFQIEDDRDLKKVSKAIALKISREGSQKYREPDKQTDVYSSILVESIDDIQRIFMAEAVSRLAGIIDNIERVDGVKVGTKEI